MTDENVRQWLSDHSDDWEAQIKRARRDLRGASPAHCEAIMKFIETQGYKRSAGK